MAKKIMVEVPVEELNKTEKKINYKYIIGFLVFLVVILVFLLVVNLINKKDNHQLDNSNVSEKTNERKVQDEHIVTCSSTRRTFAGFPYQTEFLYVGNNFTKYTYSFFLDKGKELDEDLLNNYVDYYADKMVWEVTEKGWALDDYSNPYKYRIFYSTTPKIYCDTLGGCDEIQLEFSHVNEMLKDYQEQLELKCIVK